MSNIKFSLFRAFAKRGLSSILRHSIMEYIGVVVFVFSLIMMLAKIDNDGFLYFPSFVVGFLFGEKIILQYIDNNSIK